MTERRINAPLWGGFFLTIAAFVSYFFVFARWPVTRDVPWVNYILFAIALVLIVAGLRSAWQSTRGAKIRASIAAVLALGITVFFVAAILVGTKDLPQSAHAPRVGDRAPAFTLLDTNNQQVSLQSILAGSPKGAVLIFYRGYW